MKTKTRFEVFKRDGFTCAYCGKKPPEAILEVDHIIAKVNGGQDNTDNYITSCFECNRGKGKTPLTSLPSSVAERIESINERKKQLNSYLELLEEERRKSDEDIRALVLYFRQVCDMEQYQLDIAEVSGLRYFLKVFTKYKIMEAMEMATGKTRPKTAWQCKKTFKYFCGILHNWRKNNVR